METPLVGYASIFGTFETLWKTTDGGNTWFDFTFGGQNASQVTGGTCVYATPRTIVFTQWPTRTQRGAIAGLPGGISKDGGSSFSQVFVGNVFAQSNGIDFTDDLHGVVTMGPTDPSDPAALNYETSDGGLNWTRLASLPESWGVYAVKGTSTFFCAGEGTLAQPSIYRSDDNGITWKVIFTLQNFDQPWTGHIAGAGSTVYVQGQQDVVNGFYRSADFGATWIPVGGPANVRDTRFCVTGCAGEVVYAFNDAGELWKTTDGGDGTLRPYVGNAPFILSSDTLYFSTSQCNSVTQTLPFYSQSCLAASLDSLSIAGDLDGVFSVQHISPHLDSMGHIDSTIVTFTPGFSLSDSGLLVLHGHQGSTHITETVVLKSTSTTRSPLTLVTDTVRLFSFSCDSVTKSLLFSNGSCLGTSLDSLSLLNSSAGSFLVTNGIQRIVAAGAQDSILITYIPSVEGFDSTQVTIHGHQGKNLITLLISVTGASAVGKPFVVPTDTLNLFTTYCKPVTLALPFGNQSCFPMSFDSASVSGDSLQLFSLGNTATHIVLGRSQDSIEVAFNPNGDGRDTATLSLFAHQDAQLFSKKIVLASYNQEAPQPEIGIIGSVAAGDTTLIPIYLEPTKDSFSISSYALHLSFNGDVLNPTSVVLANTLSSSGSVSPLLVSYPGRASCVVKFSTPIVTGANLTQPLVYIKAFATLSDSTETSIVLDSFAINGSAPLALCTIPAGIFQTLLGCGDSTITTVMRGEPIATFVSVTPNPSHQNIVNVTYRLSKEAVVTIRVTDALGNTIATPLLDMEEQPGVHLVSLSTEGWPSGTHFLLITTPQSGVIVRKLMEMR